MKPGTAEAVDGAAAVVEQLSRRVQELERRVSALEYQAEAPFPAPPKLRGTELGLGGTGLETSRPAAKLQGPRAAEKPAGIVPVLGIAVLGIAGAYLLRAIAESGAIPRVPVLMVAIAYAGFWMVWAARTHARNPSASVTYAVTSALILSPLLWESTVGFHDLSPIADGAVLFAYVILALALAWRRDLQVIPLLATLATVITAFALVIATRALLPLTAALLAAALATETAACLGRQLKLRVLTAVAADIAVGLLVFVGTSAPDRAAAFYLTSPATITVLGLALLAVYGASIGVRTFILDQVITVFEIVQGVLAFALGALGALLETRGIAPELGIFFLLLAVVCYWGTLSRFAGEPYARNRRVFAAWAAALLLAGILVLFPASLQLPLLCLAAVAAAYVFARTAKVSLGLHISLFLAVAAAVSPLPSYVANALAGSVPAAPGWGFWVITISAALGFAIGSRRPDEQRRRRLLWVFPAVLVGFASAALAVAAIVWLAAGRMELGASRLSVVRTLVNCALALALGFLGSRWKRVELGWAAYIAVAFGTLKLLFEDLRIGNAASLVLSFLFYGLILILLPRLLYRGHSVA